ncbi:hypothetical protein BO94DRAFT_625381 [Aspergillus sclerotioniger CBS 115572]|uniref:Protein kinase domain-containing protein n=1 Tax=Aspergillus sclerotioniger CBS 115572 TaxID=1450535 RepID=A0A317WD10_9EURO|nr:hypothetical protein BO94DRAFT_625381 [Aspergillus sclerotioniger CBS 115572]PWY83805.1 hypothetical protein BO94DRAFT_625381 [Aspergillus sclerotioniger CBS 115572]
MKTYNPSGITLDFEPSHVHFIEPLKSSETSEIFHISYDGQSYFLKVFHMDDDPGFSPDGRDLSRYRCESQAYLALSRHGTCDMGIVPQFYGVLENLDPSVFEPNLEAFNEDKVHPCAIILEYLHDASVFTSEPRSVELRQYAKDALNQIHQAGVIHNDPHPTRNLVVASGGRVVWVDFDTSIVFSGARRGELDFNEEACDELKYFESCARRFPVKGTPLQGNKMPMPQSHLSSSTVALIGE